MVTESTRFIVLIIFAAFTNIESLYCASETNIMLYVYYTSTEHILRKKDKMFPKSHHFKWLHNILFHSYSI